MIDSSACRSILHDHATRPRYAFSPSEGDRQLAGRNPECNDVGVVYASVRGEPQTLDVAVQVEGCTISTASASLMAQAVNGTSIDQALGLAELVVDVLQGQKEAHLLEPHGEIFALGLVGSYRARYGCAAFPWETLYRLLSQFGSVSK